MRTKLATIRFSAEGGAHDAAHYAHMLEGEREPQNASESLLLSGGVGPLIILLDPLEAPLQSLMLPFTALQPTVAPCDPSFLNIPPTKENMECRSRRSRSRR